MKLYTNLKQAKRLAEFLPLETADMMFSPPMLAHFKNYGDADKEQELPDYMVINVRRNIIDDSKFDEPIPLRKGDFPCWSLTALLSVLPEYHLSSPNPLEKQCCCRVKDIETYSNNPIDACVEMILNLHKLNLL